jgi:hypothetical protein
MLFAAEFTAALTSPQRGACRLVARLRARSLPEFAITEGPRTAAGALPVGKILVNPMIQPLPSLVERLVAHVQARLPYGVHDFCIQLRNDCLVLTGWTRTYYAKQRVQQCLRAMSDLPVTNEIKVVDRGPQSENPPARSVLD